MRTLTHTQTFKLHILKLKGRLEFHFANFTPVFQIFPLKVKKLQIWKNMLINPSVFLVCIPEISIYSNDIK